MDTIQTPISCACRRNCLIYKFEISSPAKPKVLRTAARTKCGLELLAEGGRRYFRLCDACAVKNGYIW